MPDPYLYDDAPVLKNKLGIKDGKVLDMIEAEQSRQNMAILYKRGFDDFSPAGLREIHRFLFGRVYEWAGQFQRGKHADGRDDAYVFRGALRLFYGPGAYGLLRRVCEGRFCDGIP